MAIINIVLFIIMDLLGSSGKNITVVKNMDSGSSTGTIDYVSLGKLFYISVLQVFSFFNIKMILIVRPVRVIL